MKYVFFFTWFCILLSADSIAQNYHAIQGSSYAGALGVHNNPASIVNTPFSWDVAIFGTQLKSSTNAFTIYNYSLLSSPANSLYNFKNGQYSRFTSLNFNSNLLNARIAINRKHSIAFGANIRSYSNIKTSDYNSIDTIKSFGDFFKLNENNTAINGKVLSSSWLEGFLTYSRTIYDNEKGRLNVGVTVRLSKGISGAFAGLDNLQFSKTIQNNNPVYSIDNTNLTFGYSHNYDQWKNSNSSSQNINNFLFAYTEGGASLDAGIEYLIKPQGTTSFYDDENYYDYDWKFGLSLLDAGGNQYKYGAQSRYINAVKNNITNTILDTKFDSTINSLKTFNDSLSGIVNQAFLQSGKFKIINPMRMVLNVDRYLYGNFYVNAEISINIPLTFKNYMQVKELNLITVTPRWETKKLGAYLPVQFNNQKQFWIGGAFKAGPLLIGVHNWANIFSKTKIQNGGGYIAFIIRSPKELPGKRDKKLDCPKSVW